MLIGTLVRSGSWFVAWGVCMLSFIGTHETTAACMADSACSETLDTAHF